MVLKVWPFGLFFKILSQAKSLTGAIRWAARTSRVKQLMLCSKRHLGREHSPSTGLLAPNSYKSHQTLRHMVAHYSISGLQKSHFFLLFDKYFLLLIDQSVITLGILMQMKTQTSIWTIAPYSTRNHNHPWIKSYAKSMVTAIPQFTSHSFIYKLYTQISW